MCVHLMLQLIHRSGLHAVPAISTCSSTAYHNAVNVLHQAGICTCLLANLALVGRLSIKSLVLRRV